MKIVVPLHLSNIVQTPDTVQTGFKKFYLKTGFLKLYDSISESDVVLDRPLDNFTPLSGAITSSDTVLTAIEKLVYSIANISVGATSWGDITGVLTTQTDLINYLNSNFYSITNPNNYITSAALAPYLTSSTADLLYYPLSSNPAGYLTQELVEEYPDFVSLPPTGVEGIIYITADTGFTYTWNSGTSSYVITAPIVTGITGSGIINRVAKFTGSTVIGSAKMIEMPSGLVYIGGAFRSIISGNTILSLQRSQTQMDFVLGNPGYSQPNIITSDNDLDGLEIRSKGVMVFKTGSSYLESFRILSNLNIQLTSTPPTGTNSDKILVREVSTGLLKQIDYPVVTGFVPTSRTITINGTTYDLSADRSWTISAGVWGSITGTLASQTDLITYLSSNYVSLLGSYANPSWITSLAWSKVTGAPAFITGITSSDVTAALGYTPENIANKSSSYSVSSTVTYPNTKALVDGLATKSTVIETTTDGTVTSTLVNTVSQVLLIPGGTFGEGMTLETLGWARKTGANGPMTYRRYINTAPNLGGSPILIAQPGASASATVYAGLRRFLRIKTSDGSGAGTELTNVSSTSYDDVPGTSNTAVSNVAINWNNDVYIIDALQCSSSSDSARVSSLKVRR